MIEINRTKVITWRLIAIYCVVFWIAFTAALIYCLQ
nr:MAG TPA: hypothetical protein [Caudoviricetes sp.]